MAAPSGSLERLWVHKTVDLIAADLRKALTEQAAEAIKARGVFHVALSGGSLPATLAKALLDSSHKPLLDTSKWQWWFADERCVAKADADSNYAEAEKQLLQYLKPAEGAVHAIDESKIDKPEEAAAAYEAELRKTVPTGELDCILLGMGPDGHCCSLFPDHALLTESKLWIAPISDSPKPPPKRITMTLPLVNLARSSIFVVTGSSKADALRDVLAQRKACRNPAIVGKPGEKDLPSARVRSKDIMFLADQDAASKLPFGCC